MSTVQEQAATETAVLVEKLTNILLTVSKQQAMARSLTNTTSTEMEKLLQDTMADLLGGAGVQGKDMATVISELAAKLGLSESVVSQMLRVGVTGSTSTLS